jgi:hypothetical protein
MPFWCVAVFPKYWTLAYCWKDWTVSPCGLLGYTACSLSQYVPPKR